MIPERPMAGGMSPTVLVADDDYDNRTITQTALEQAGYKVMLAVNGLETLEKIITGKPVLLLLDLSMPKLNGWEVAKQIRQMPEHARPIVIAFTAHALVGDELKAKASGCDDYISKPCLPKDMVAKVGAWIKKRLQTQPSERV